MTALAHDDLGQSAGRAPAASGLLLALASAVAFGLSGALARPLLDAGWTPGAVVLVRIALGSVVIVPFGLVSLHGRWHLLWRARGIVVLYGLLAVAGAQLCYFTAVSYMEVGPALLIEYTAPAAVVVWMWLRRGQRPGLVTLGGAAVCAVGLVLVLDLLSGADLSGIGVLWALAAMVGCAAYFIIIGDDSTGLPPLALGAGGMVVGAVVLGLAALVGVMPVRAASADVTYGGVEVGWWVPLLVLGLVTAGFAYSTGIMAGRLLGSRLASFVALSEVVMGVLWAWLLLDQLPAALQLVGGALVVLGVVAVRLGEQEMVGEMSATGATPELPAA